MNAEQESSVFSVSLVQPAGRLLMCESRRWKRSNPTDLRIVLTPSHSVTHTIHTAMCVCLRVGVCLCVCPNAAARQFQKSPGRDVYENIIEK